jgi:hypothetical protein
MAYNNYYPVTYQPNYYGQPNPYYQQMQNAAMMQQNQQMQQAQQNQPVQQPTIQQSGFVLVQSEQEARAYPVAPGNSITFKDESQPYCYVKTMGFNQLDRPVFERYRLVKEDSLATAQNAPASVDGAEGKDTAYALKSDVEALWSAVKEIRAKVKTQAEVTGDE